MYSQRYSGYEISRCKRINYKAIEQASVMGGQCGVEITEPPKIFF